MTEHSISWNLDYTEQVLKVSCTCGWFYRGYSLRVVEYQATDHLSQFGDNGEHRADMASLDHSNNNLGAQNMFNSQNRITELEQALEAQKKAHEAFKRQVAQTAMKYARANDWCDTVRDALNEVGVDPDAGAKWIRLQVDVKVQLSTNYDYLDAPEKFNTASDYSGPHGMVDNAGTPYFSVEFNEDDDGADRVLGVGTHIAEIIDCRGYPRVLSVSDEIPAMVTNV